MNHRTRRFWAIAALFSLVLANGFHVAALQGLGYVRMFDELRQFMPAEEAFDLTFSGTEICGICLAVDEIQAELQDDLNDFEQFQNAVGSYLISYYDKLPIPPGRRGYFGQTGENQLLGHASPPLSPPPKA